MQSRQDLPPIYLLRHGETLWNSLGRYQGRLNSALTQRGKVQAEKVAQLLEREIQGRAHEFAFITSPLGRARETADIVASSLRQPFTEDALLMEVSAGCWDGMTRLEIGVEYPDYLAGSNEFDWYFRSPDGETIEAVSDRITSWFSTVTQPTIAVSHGVLGRLIRGLYLGLPQQEMLELPVPQDGFFCLHAGTITCID